MPNLQMYLFSTKFFFWHFTINKVFIQNFSLFWWKAKILPHRKCPVLFWKLIQRACFTASLLNRATFYNNGLSSFEDFFIWFINDNLTLSMCDLIAEKVCCSESIFCSNCNWLSKTVLHPFFKQRWRLQNWRYPLFWATSGNICWHC